MTHDYVTQHLLQKHLHILQRLQYRSGLFGASKQSVQTGYDKAWLRDNFYECLAFFVLKDYETCKQTYKALLRIFEKHEEKIDMAIRQKPEHKYQYIHARVHPETFDEFWEDWGNKQNDAIGAILFGIARLEQAGIPVIETEKDKELVQKLVHYLGSIQYWHDQDSGMWEENEEVHSSSVGACVAGLKAINGFVEVPDDLIRKGQEALDRLLPRESRKKFVDLAQLSLIYPYHVVNKHQEQQILDHVEYLLVRSRGLIRYKNDAYYNKNQDQYSEEAEWVFGFSWLAIIYKEKGDRKKAEYYLEKVKADDTVKGMPELYYSDSSEHNDNTPLGWAESMFIIALYKLSQKHASPGAAPSSR